MDNSGIRLLSRKERNANFRTAAHNVLIKSDDQYDARYHATTLVHTKLWALYNTVLSALTSEALDKAELSFKQFCTATGAKRNRVFVTLSGTDAYINYFILFIAATHVTRLERDGSPLCDGSTAIDSPVRGNGN